MRAIEKNKKSVNKISVERIKDELEKMLIDKNRASAFIDMKNLGILEELLPEITNMIDVKQPKNIHAEGDVFTHTMLVLNSNHRLKNPIILWSLLFHDVGKPDTFILKDRIRFPKHQKVGVDIAKKIMKRFKFSKKEIFKISWLIEHHMMLPDILKMKPNRQLRFFKNKWFKDLLKVFKADVSGCRPFDLNLYYKVEEIYQRRIKEKTNIKKKLITGNDVMKTLKIEPGPKVGEILNRVDELYLDGKIDTKEKAIDYLRKQVKYHCS